MDDTADRRGRRQSRLLWCGDVGAGDPEQERFLIDALGFRKAGVDGAYHRYRDSGRRVRSHHRSAARARPRARELGVRLAARVPPHRLSRRHRQRSGAAEGADEELGYTDASEIKDRYYFHSMYVRSPGGILVECTANVPGGSTRTRRLRSSAPNCTCRREYEEQRDDILAQLEPLTVPEEFRPKSAVAVSRSPVPPPAARTSTIALSRTKADFAVKNQ